MFREALKLLICKTYSLGPQPKNNCWIIDREEVILVGRIYSTYPERNLSYSELLILVIFNENLEVCNTPREGLK